MTSLCVPTILEGDIGNKQQIAHINVHTAHTTHGAHTHGAHHGTHTPHTHTHTHTHTHGTHTAHNGTHGRTSKCWKSAGCMAASARLKTRSASL